MAAVELLLIRHGRIQGRPLSPRDDDPLSAMGIEQVKRTAEYLAREPVEAALISSPLRRARQTAQIIGERLHCEPVIVDTLKEMDRRELRRVVFAEIAERMPLGKREAWLRRGERLRAPVVERVGGAMSTLTSEPVHNRLLVVVHGGVIWALLTYYFPRHRELFKHGRQVANASVTRIKLASGRAELVSINETAHLGNLVTY